VPQYLTFISLLEGRVVKSIAKLDEGHGRNFLPGSTTAYIGMYAYTDAYIPMCIHACICPYMQLCVHTREMTGGNVLGANVRKECRRKCPGENVLDSQGEMC